MSDWWAKKLGTPTPQTSQPPVGPAPSSPPETPPPSTAPENLSEALEVGATKGGPRQKTEGNQRCPHCGSGNFFQRKNASSRMGNPMPRCYDCGYPLLQHGTEI